MAIKLILLIAFFGMMVCVGLYCRKGSKDVNGFVLGGRSVGPWLTAFSYGTSYFSAVIFVGYAGQFGWKFGLASTWIGLGNAFLGSLLAWKLLGYRTRVMTQHLDSSTMPEFFGKRFGSRALRLGASALVFVFLIPYTASLYNGLSRLFGMAFNVDYTVCIIIMAALTAVYVIAGGYMAAAMNDFIQGLIMLAGIVAVIFAVGGEHGGIMESIRQLGLIADPSAGIAAGEFTALGGPDPFSLLCVVVLTSLGTWGLPQMVQKFYAIKNEKVIPKGMVISTVFAIVVAGGCYFLGGFGRLFGDRVDVAAEGFDAIIPAMLMNLPDLLIGIVIILVLSASMSTLSALVLTSSATLTLDFLKGVVARNMTDKTQVFVMRVLIVVFILISVIIAIVQYRSSVTFIAQLMGVSWGALAGAFLAPYLYGLYWRRTTKPAVWASFIFGAGIMVVNLLARGSFPAVLQSPINCGAFAMLAGLAIVPVVSAFTKPPEAELVEHCFSCLKKKD